MAERHVRAVQLHSKLSDRLTRNILEIIALDIGREGQPAFTSSRIIAKRARCAVNTARERIEDILKSKELMRTIEGRYSVYSLNPELIPYDSVAEETHEDGGVTAQFARIDDLAAMEKRMYQNLQDCINPLYQLYQTIVSTVSTDQRETDTKGIGKNKENIYIAPSPALVNDMINALSRASKTPYGAGFNEELYDQAAHLLLKQGFTPEQVDTFPEYWLSMGWGWRRGLPTLEKVVEEMGNCVNRVDTRAEKDKNPSGVVSNGVKPAEDPAVWKLVTEAVSTGNYKGLSPEQFAAVKKVGPSEIKARNDFTANKVRAEFFRALQGAKC